jgi:hypothetical protein
MHEHAVNPIEVPATFCVTLLFGRLLLWRVRLFRDVDFYALHHRVNRTESNFADPRDSDQQKADPGVQKILRI